MSKDERVNVDEVLDSSFVNQDLPLKKEVSASAEPNNTKQRVLVFPAMTSGPK